MKRIIFAFTICLLLHNSGRAQTNDKGPVALGATMAVFGSGLVAGYLVSTNNSISKFHSEKGPITSADKRSIRRDNLPWLLTGGACYLISVLSFCDAANVQIHFKKSKAAVGLVGNGIGFSYTMK